MNFYFYIFKRALLFLGNILTNESISKLSNTDLALLFQATDWDQLVNFSRQLLARLHIHDFMLRMKISDKNGSVHSHIFGSLPQRLIDLFHAHNKDDHDPIMSHVVKSGLPLEWQIDPLCQANESECRYKLLRTYGITSGISMAARSEHSFSCIDFYSNDLTTITFGKKFPGDLFLFSSYLDEATRSLWAGKIPKQAQLLTVRERECLVWSAQGKTANEIGTILSISQHTVYFHLKKVAAKLNVYGTRHAITRATELGLIKPIYGTQTIP